MFSFRKPRFFRPGILTLWSVAALAGLLALALAGCSPGQTTYRLGAVHPLTGDGAGYGIPVERVIQRAVRDINQQWAAENRHLELIVDDGKCQQAAALAAAQRLVEDSGVKVIYGGSCSDETLGMAPYVEANEVVMLTPLSTSSAISAAGDYIFRNIPGNGALAQALVDALPAGEFSRFAILADDTAFARDLREWFIRLLPGIGGEIVADEIVPSGEGDYNAVAERIVAANPDFVIVLPQTIPDTGYLLRPLRAAGYAGPGASNTVASVPEAVNQFADLLEGFYLPAVDFKMEGHPEFNLLQADTDCDLAHYCAIAYDGVILLSEMLLECGDQNTVCMRDFLYGTQNWDGPYYGLISFDQNGDVAGSFHISRLEQGQLVPVQ